VSTQWHQRFFQSTRGQVLSLLRSAERTVAELTTALGVTHNAVRMQLTALERDGLVEQRGIRRSLRKPHLVYALTEDAEALFPKAYSPMLSELLAVLAARLPKKQLVQILDTVGQNMAHAHFPVKPVDLEQRLEEVMTYLSSIGAEVEVARDGDVLWVKGRSCPMADTVKSHPQACRALVSFLQHATGVEVSEHCEKGGRPRCGFEVRLACPMPA
jgi:predicted ArsR family transcriptional regulator